MMSLEKFLNSFFNILIKNEIRYCVLRNYEGLPVENPGNDIDILIAQEDTPKILSALNNMNDIAITGISNRHYVISIFIKGVVWGDNFNSIQIDLVTKLTFKGLPYLSVSSVLSQVKKISGTNELIKRPSAVHEAIISLFSSYVIGGWIKDRYWEKIKSIFKDKEKEVVNTLSSFLAKDLSLAIVEGVINDNRPSLLKKLPLVRYSLFFKNFSMRPFYSITAVSNHYFAEVLIKFTPKYIDTICFLGPDGAGKSSVIHRITHELKFATKNIQFKHLKPKILNRGATTAITNPHASPPRSWAASILKIFYWLVLYWFDYIFHGQRNCALIIWDRYFHDLIVDPKRYRYGGPLWLAKVIAKLIPQPDLFILLDAPADVLQNRKKEVSFDETSRQCKSYIELIKKMENGYIIDASQSLEKVVEDTQKIIINLMVQKTRKRFDF